MRFVVVLLGAVATSSLAAECPRLARASAEPILLAQATAGSTTSATTSTKQTSSLIPTGAINGQGLRIDPRLSLQSA
ncbi:MAG: hypothetical protein ACO3AX_02975, partial [Burkholderiaceae bacterium]